MRHTAQLWETRWWGWDEIGDKGRFDQPWKRVGSAVASDKCRKNGIRVTGKGNIEDVDGRRYAAETESEHVNNPCRL